MDAQRTSYTSTLMKAMSFIEEGKISDAEYVVNNYYYKHKRSREDYVNLLRLTMFHRAFCEAREDTRQKLAEILYLLDRKHNQPTNDAFVIYTTTTLPDGSETKLFHLVEKGSQPAS